MKTAIIIATHGAAAEPLLMTTQMIIGSQANVSAVSFLPGENIDTLRAKYEDVIAQLDVSDGILFLVDIYAGTPYNAASLLALEQPDRDVVTGVSVPMLVHIFLEREELTGYTELVESTMDMAREGVKSLKTSLQNNNREEDL